VTAMPRQTRLFLAGNTVSMAGTGLVIAFTLIYLHQVRGLPSRWSGPCWPPRPQPA
jgi:hypothetical protein